MKEIKDKFELMQTNNPGWSSFVCFEQAIRGEVFSDEELMELFKKLVAKGDYSKTDETMVFDYLKSQLKQNRKQRPKQAI